jgi:hypothetical protein
MNGLYAMILYNEKNQKVYSFSVPLGVPWQEAHEVALEFAQGVLDLQKQIEDQAKKKQDEETSQEMNSAPITG